MAKTKKSKNYFSSKYIIPAIAVLIFATIGSYAIVKSKAWSVNISGAFGYGCNTYTPPTLKLGSTGECVKVVQKGVNNWISLFNLFHGGTWYQTVTVDGIYGSKTITAVKAYQTQHHLTADGIVGPYTWAVMSQDCAWWGSCQFGSTGK